MSGQEPPRGTARLKSEYIVARDPEAPNTTRRRADVLEDMKTAANGECAEEEGLGREKLVRVELSAGCQENLPTHHDGSEKDERAVAQKPKPRGQNKVRDLGGKVDFSHVPCPHLVDTDVCERHASSAHASNNKNNRPCKYSHDLHACYQRLLDRLASLGEANTVCSNFSLYGYCVFGLTCMYGPSHLDAKTYANVMDVEKFRSVVVSKATASKLEHLYCTIEESRENAALDAHLATFLGSSALLTADTTENKANLDTNLGSEAPLLLLPVRRNKVEGDEAVVREINAFLSLHYKDNNGFLINTIRNLPSYHQEVFNTVTGELTSRLKHYEYNFKPTIDYLAKEKLLYDRKLNKGNSSPLAMTESVSDTRNFVDLSDCREIFNINASVRRSRRPQKTFVRNSSDRRSHLSPEATINDLVGQLYVAPLTTVGNLPFRRICKFFGADITCSEMIMSSNMVAGKRSELDLLHRHASEDLFGIQLCSSEASNLAFAGQILNDRLTSAGLFCDFVDLNCGCPVDSVVNTGAGSGLLARKGKLLGMVRAMRATIGAPISVKIRTGVSRGKNTAHALIPDLYASGASMVTLHGRSREQRYTKHADWEYIHECCPAGQLPVVESYSADADTASKNPLGLIRGERNGPYAFYGNGDIFNYQDAARLLAENKSSAEDDTEENGDAAATSAEMGVSRLSGLMIGRGVLIKPWLLTEIREQRYWDISASERLDLIKTYIHYGLSYYGSDAHGIIQTRRFALEWLSFLYRYIPVGLLERLPVHINERPPRFRGRSELETLLASDASSDWVKITEMFLGKAGPEFSFTPKHVSHSY